MHKKHMVCSKAQPRKNDHLPLLLQVIYFTWPFQPNKWSIGATSRCRVEQIPKKCAVHFVDLNVHVRALPIVIGLLSMAVLLQLLEYILLYEPIRAEGPEYIIKSECSNIFAEKPIKLAECRGLAVLVTCDYKETEENELPGTEEDFVKMEETFRQFDYDVHTLKNKEATVNAVDDLMQSISSYLKHYGHDSCTCGEKVIVFAFSGHGEKDKIVLHDGTVSLFTNILTYLLGHNHHVFKIPKLFFINACRGKDELKRAMARNDFSEEEGNYRFDYSTIPNYIGYENTKWMVKLAEMLIDPVEGNDSLQNISAKLKQQIVGSGTEKVQLQQCETMDRLNTGPLNLYYKKI